MITEQNSINWKKIFCFKNIALNLVGVVLITLALKGFMIPNKFLDGGIIGISILVHEITKWPFGVLVLVLNIPFLFIGKRMLGKTFAFQSLLTFVLIAVSMTFLDVDPVTSDPLLIALFGGCLIGVGMGLCIRSGSTADGVEILSVGDAERMKDRKVVVEAIDASAWEALQKSDLPVVKKKTVKKTVKKRK